jgi:hypothetical protein
VTSSSSTARARYLHGERALEILAVTLLGIATIGSAWSAYQSTRWNGKEADRTQDSADARLEATRQFGLATQIVSYDSNMVAQYAQAVVAGNDKLAQFYRESLIRPAFLPILDRWQATITATGKAPPNLLQDQDYLDAQLVGYRASEADAEASAVASDDASRQADQYVLLTLVFASALFFAGVTSSFRMRFARILMLVGATVLIAYAAARLADYPVA